MATRTRKMVCKYCGSENILVDAWARWNRQAGDWELANTFCAGTCEDCGSDSNNIAESRPITVDTDAMMVCQEGDPIPFDLATLFIENEFTDAEAAVIRATLAQGKTYRDGGGAAAEWAISPYRS